MCEQPSGHSLTLRKSFFDDLWPLILKENRCAIELPKTDQFMPKPRERFDDFWAHGFLYDKGYFGYSKPLEFHCKFNKEPSEEATEAAELPISEDEPDSDAECWPHLYDHIATLDERDQGFQADDWARHQLANEYVNRSYPWYMNPSTKEFDPKLLATLTKEQWELLDQIKANECNLIIIDVNFHIDMPELERWRCFGDVVHVIAVVRNLLVQRQIQHRFKQFNPIVFEESFETTWQQELDASLQFAVAFAKRRLLIERCTDKFLFVFSRKLCGSKLDMAKFLQQS